MARSALVELASQLVLRGVITAEAAEQAARRAQLYGGSLDTVLLEMGLVDEKALWTLLSHATGLPAPTLAKLGAPDRKAAAFMAAAEAKRLGAVPLRLIQGGIEMAVRPTADFDQLIDWGQTHGLSVELMVVPEVRFWALMGAVYQEPIPPRLFATVAKVMGADRARQWAEGRAPERKVSPPRVNTGPLLPGERPKEPETPPPVEVGGIEIVEDHATLISLPVSAAPPLSPPVPVPIAAPVDTVPEIAETEVADADVVVTDAGAPTETDAYFVVDGHDVDLLLEIYELEPDSTAGRSAAAKVLQRTTPGHLLKCLPERIGRRPEAERALLRLVAAFGSRVAGMLVPLLGHPAPAWRRWAVGVFEFTDASGPEPMLCDLAGTMTANEEDEAIRRAALRALRRRLAHPGVAALAESLRAEALSTNVSRACQAITDLGEMRDPGAVPVLTDALKSAQTRVVMAAHAALVDITKQDFGTARWRWGGWWRQFGDRNRVEWLLEALGHKSPQMRLAASIELRELTGEYLGYHFDLSKRDRDEARQRWWSWWESSGRTRFDRVSRSS